MNLTRFFHRRVFALCGKVHSKPTYLSPCGLASASSLAEVRFRPVERPAETPSKKPKRPPFIARYFVGDIDEAMFEYPELTGQQLQHMKELASVIEDFYKSNVNIPEIRRLDRIPGELLSELKSLGLFGLTAPRVYGGLELGAVEMNYLGEIISQNPAIFHLINFHNIYGVNIILKGGTEDQKHTLLPKLVSGDLTFGVCIWEKNCGSDLHTIQTTAVPLDKESFLLSGTKIWVNNVENADKLLVLANVKRSSNNPDPDLTFFLVDKNDPKISIKPFEKTCLEQLGTFEVSFDSLIVNASSIVGSTGKGFELANSAVLNDRTIMPSAVVQTVRSLFDSVVKHVTHREQFGQPLLNFDLIKWKVAQASIKLHVLESMVYMTAGISDTYDGQDIQVESAVTKVFALETLQYCCNVFSDIFSSRVLEKDFDLALLWKDCQFLNVCEGSKDVLKMHIALAGLRLMGEREHDRVRKVRNPLQFPKERIQEVFTSLKQAKDEPIITQVVSNNLHPTLMVTADTLEYCIHRLRWAVQLNIIHHATEITRHQNVMIGLADMLIECYAMAATQARASRSYCIGLKNAEAEIMTAHVYTSQQVAKIRQAVEYLNPHDPPVNNDTIHSIADAIGASKRYFAEHPTARNYV